MPLTTSVFVQTLMQHHNAGKARVLTVHPVHAFIHLSIQLFACLFICTFACQAVCLYFHSCNTSLLLGSRAPCARSCCGSQHTSGKMGLYHVTHQIFLVETPRLTAQDIWACPVGDRHYLIPVSTHSLRTLAMRRR